MRARARGLGEGVEIELSLTVDTLFPIATVGAALVEMRIAYPAVSIRLAVEPLGGPVTSLIEKRSTLAIIVGEDFRDPRIALEAVGSIEQVAVVSPRHPLGLRSKSEDLGLPDLADHLQIVLADPTPLSEGRSFGVLSPQTCRVSSQDTKHAMILAGLGWGRLVRLATKALGRKGQVSSEAYIAHRLDEPLGPAAHAFRTALARLVVV